MNRGKLDADPVSLPFGLGGGPLLPLEPVVQPQDQHDGVGPIRRGQRLREPVIRLLAPFVAVVPGHVRPLGVQNPGLGSNGAADALQDGDRLRWEPVVIAQKDVPVVRVGANDGDAAHVLFQGQEAALVLQQYQRFAGRLPCEAPVLRAVDLLVGNACVGNALRRVEHSEAEPCAKQPCERPIDLPLPDQPMLHGVDKGGKNHPAFKVAAVVHGKGRGLLGCAGHGVMGVEIENGPAVGHHVSLETPLLSQYLSQEGRAGAAGFSVGAVVGAHHGLRTALHDAVAEGGKVGFPKVLHAHARVEMVTKGFRTAVRREMLRRGGQLEVLRVVALETLDEGHSHTAREVRILPVGFLAPAPARVTKDVDVGAPESETMVLAAVALAGELMVLGPGFVRYGRRHPAHQLRIEGRGQRDGLRENSGDARPAHAMEGFVPPVVFGDVETGDGLGIIDHLGDFLLKGQPTEQVLHALIERKVGVEEREFRHGSSLMNELLECHTKPFRSRQEEVRPPQGRGACSW